jgi:hypothetical protein
MDQQTNVLVKFDIGGQRELHWLYFLPNPPRPSVPSKFLW